MFFSFVLVSASILFLQNISDISFLKNELIYLASPYYDLEGFAKSIVFLLSYLFVIVLIWMSVFVRSRFVWFVMFIFFFICTLLDVFIQFAVNDLGFTRYEYSISLIEYKSYRNMVVFLLDGVRSLIVAVFFSSILMFVRMKSERRIPVKMVTLFAIVVLVVVFGAKQWVFYIKYPSYPAVIKMPMIIADYHLTKNEEKPRVLDQNIKPDKQVAINGNIIWIIDESIGGKYLSINGFEKYYTVFRKFSWFWKYD